MNCQVKVEIEKAPAIAELITQQLNQLGYLGGMANLLSLKDSPAFIDIDRFIDESSTLMLLIRAVEENFPYFIQTNFAVSLNADEIEGFEQPARSYKTLQELLASFTSAATQQLTLTDFFLGYISYWQSYGNVRALKLMAEQNPKFQPVLNLAICKLYNKFVQSNSIDNFLADLFEEYYYGYILGDDVLYNLFVGRVRLYIFLTEKKAEDKISLKELFDAIFDTEILFREENKNVVVRSYKALVNFCYDKFDECLESNDETELLLSHAKLQGLVGLIRQVAHTYGLLDNLQLAVSKDFFEEIHCDCRPWAAKNFSFFEVPDYVHWILHIMSYDHESEKLNIEKILSASKERMFLSKRTLAYINSQDLNLLTRDEILGHIKLKYSDLDERVIKPLQFLKNIQAQTLRKRFFDAEDFERVYSEYDTYSESIYEKYTELSIQNVDEVPAEIKSCISKTHTELWKNEVRGLLQVNAQEDVNFNEKLELNLLFEQLYPFSSIVKQEVAILQDIGGEHQQALDTICKAIFIEFNDPLLWQSLLVILKNLHLLESCQLVNFICISLNNESE